MALVELGQRALVALDDGRAERGIVGVAEITLRMEVPTIYRIH